MLDIDTLVSKLQKYSDMSTSRADQDLSKLRSKADGRIKETNKRLDIILETVTRFKEEVEEAEALAMDKYSNRIYEEVNSTINSINRPTDITLRVLETYAEETRSSFLKQDQVLIKYVKLLKGSKYVKRVKSLSKALQKLNSDLSKLERFIITEYTPSAGIENISLIIDDVFRNLEKLDENYRLIEEKQDQIIVKNMEIDKIKEELLLILNHPVKVDLQNAKDSFITLQKDIDSKFQNIRKALRKYENNLSKMKNKPDTTLLKELLKDMTMTIATQGSLGGISSLLTAIDDELDNAALKLKKDKREATKSDITQLLEGEINQVWQTSKSTYQKWKELENKLSDLELDSEEIKVSTNLEAAKRDRNRIIEREMRDFEKVKEATIKIIEDITAKIKSTIDPEVNLESELVSLPDWAVIIE